MGEALAGIHLAAAGLLVLAGVPKLRDPLPLVRALRSSGLPGGKSLVRLIAAGEVLLGLAAVAVPSAVTALLLAASYAVFTGFVVLTLVRGGVLGSCGCFGKPDTPPSPVHAVVTLGFALACAAGAVAPVTSAATWVAGPLAGLAVPLSAALVAMLAYLVLGVLPTTTARAVTSAAGARRTTAGGHARTAPGGRTA